MKSSNVPLKLQDIPDLAEYDVVVAGAGAAGMAAAVFAAIEGSKVLLIESTQYVGGTSALSGGTTWVPLTRLGKQLNPTDTYDKVLTFLDAAIGNHASKAQREAFLKAGPEAIHTLLDKTDVDFRPCAYHPDYMADLPEATVNGRALEPLPYNTRHLGEALKLIRPTIPEFTVLGGMMINREDINNLLARFKSIKSFAYTVRLFLNFQWDKMRYGQTARSVMGHALIARLLSSAIKSGVDIVTNTNIEELITTSGTVTGVRLRQDEVTRTVNFGGGLVLAGGGFGRGQKKRDAFLPEGTSSFSPSAPGHTGALHDLALSVGAVYGKGEDQSAFWAPVSVRERKDGSTAVYPHFVFDRSKPGTLCVGMDGKRFVNESTSYHEFGKAMLAGGKSTNTAFIVCDAKAIAKYGLGIVRLGGDKLGPYLKDGYLIEGKSLDDLAQKMGVSSGALKSSVEHINNAADTGEDTQFNRGSTVYQKANGDAAHGPNPTLGRLDTAPFFAVKLYPGDIGSAKGLVGDVHARLLREDGSVVDGLYACGNDLHSIMGGKYPGPGITIGPGMVFGYLAAQHAAKRATQ